MIDINDISKEITDKYSIDNNTFIRVAKDDPKDRIEVIIGDDKEQDFKPQVKLKRWDRRMRFLGPSKRKRHRNGNSCLKR